MAESSRAPLTNSEGVFISGETNMKQQTLTWTQTAYLATLFASMLLVSGCAAMQGKKEKATHSDPPFLPEFAQVGWLWTDGQKEPVPYVPREGDIIFASSIARAQTILYRTIGGIGLPHHMIVVVKNNQGQLGTFEVGAGSDKRAVIRPIFARLKEHKVSYPGSTIAVRQIKRALTCDESRRLTCFAESQVGKPFTKLRDLTKLGLTGRALETSGLHTEQWFCSQLATHALVECGLVKGISDPGKIVPEDVYHDTEYDFSGLWTKPTDWTYVLEPTTVKPLRDPSREPTKLGAKLGAKKR